MATPLIRTIPWDELPAPERQKLFMRSQTDLAVIERDVRTWIQAVAAHGDDAILSYIQKFDDKNFDIKRLRVTQAEIGAAMQAVGPNLITQMKEQIRISRAFHDGIAATLPKQWECETQPGLRAGYKRVPLDAVGLYVPAGKAPLPSTAQMLTVAAKAAGVPRAVVCFPPNSAEDSIIVSAHLAGADEIYRVGGIVAIAALAIGTQTIKPVHKIAGPGNNYVQAAKLQLVQNVGIDMLSGPSEIMVLADGAANPAFIAADLLAQCEHGSDSAGTVLTTDVILAEKISQAVEEQFAAMGRQDYARESLSRHSAVILVKNEDEMVEICNAYAPEHLAIMTRDPNKLFARIRHAGSVFLGPYSPVAAGDYASGPNHCLPTGVAPRFSAAVSPETFMKTVQFQELSREALQRLQPIVQAVADVEGLGAHSASVTIRLVA